MNRALVAHRRGRLELALSSALAWLALSGLAPAGLVPASLALQGAAAGQVAPAAQEPVAPPSQPAAAPQAESGLNAIDNRKTIPSADAAQRQIKLRTLFEGALTDTENWQDHVETAGYRKMLTSIASLSAEDFAQLPIHDLDYAQAMADPDGQRGEYVRWRGLLGHIKAIKLDTPVFDMTDVYRGVVTDAAGENGVLFDLVEPPPRIKLRDDVVDVEGVLYRGLSYLNPKDQEIRAPYLIARVLRRVDTTALPRSTGSLDSFMLVLILVAGTFFVGRVAWYFLVQRKKPRASQLKPATIRQMFDERRAHTAGDSKSVPPK